MAGVILLAAGAVVTWTGIAAWVRDPRMAPVADMLFQTDHRPIYVLVFTGFVIWMGLTPAWVGGFLARRKQYVPAIGIWAGLIGLCAWFLARFSLTADTLARFLGDRASGWAGDWMMAGRFIAFQIPFSLMIMIVSLTVVAMADGGISEGLRRGLKSLLWTLPWLAVAAMALVIVGDGQFVPRSAWRASAARIWPVAVVAFLWLTWAGMAAFLLQFPPKRDRCAELHVSDERAAPRNPGRAYLVLSAAYLVMLVYGCLVPLDINPMPLSLAWDTFCHRLGSSSQAWSQSDAVTNIAMFVPLTFCALGAWSRENQRCHWWYMVPLLFAAGFAISIFLEFVQVFSRARVVSIHDVISQTIGNAAGLGAWIMIGPALTHWVRGLLRERRKADLGMKILTAYAALFVLHNLLPLNPTISLSQLMGKYRHGMINFIPFQDKMGWDVYPLLMKTAVYVPIGCLLATRFAGRKRPVLTGIAGGLAFACGMEFIQIFIKSRLATTTDVVLGTIGIGVGAMLADTFGVAARGPGINGWWWQRYGTGIKLLASTVWLGAVTWKAWQPFHFHRPTSRDVADVFTTPLFDIVRQVDPLVSLSRLGREVGAYLVLSMLVQSLLAHKIPGSRYAAWTITAASAVVVEFGRFYFSRYRPDLTVLLACLFGCMAGIWAYPRFVAVFLKPLSEEARRPD
ncbi:MAG: VanZ family protein [Pirellulaceae bacterium]